MSEPSPPPWAPILLVRLPSSSPWTMSEVTLEMVPDSTDYTVYRNGQQTLSRMYVAFGLIGGNEGYGFASKSCQESEVLDGCRYLVHAESCSRVHAAIGKQESNGPILGRGNQATNMCSVKVGGLARTREGETYGKLA
ncbi:hypothetical protein EDD85DRAFT_795394 [Armillaria nabsnona]|nr:hypothetical protein EDD85DRAFT_795394 [Armillaria nabsnona]